MTQLELLVETQGEVGTWEGWWAPRSRGPGSRPVEGREVWSETSRLQARPRARSPRLHGWEQQEGRLRGHPWPGLGGHRSRSLHHALTMAAPAWQVLVHGRALSPLLGAERSLLVPHGGLDAQSRSWSGRSLCPPHLGRGLLGTRMELQARTGLGRAPGAVASPANRHKGPG